MKRELSNGRWDRVLKAKMVELSEADNYDEAKEEWVATGNIFWIGSDDEIPAFVKKHRGFCLCGHKIYYHFEILNEVNGTIECVGSDHINSYLILKDIRAKTGLSEDMITDAMIEEWINTKIKTMKAEAWWTNNGEQFENDFNRVKDLDLRINVNSKGYYWDNDLKMNRPKTFIRKRSNRGGMASIVWRWNHPNNPKNQMTKHGYPNKRLLADMASFLEEIDEHAQYIKEQDEYIEGRINRLKAAEEIRLRRTNENKAKIIDDMMEFYGVNNYRNFRSGLDDWSNEFLESIESRVIVGAELSAKQLTTLKEIMLPATEKQINFLRSLGYEDTTPISKRQANMLIRKRA